MGSKAKLRGKTVDVFTSAEVKGMSTPGIYRDGPGLFLQVVGNSKTWIFRYSSPTHRNGKGIGRQREMGLGASFVLSLGDAREAAAECRRMVKAGIDPIDDRAKGRAVAIVDAAPAPSFEKIARQCWSLQKSGFTNIKHQAQWIATLETYAFPTIGDKLVDQITLDDVEAILAPIWLPPKQGGKHETATRVRQRIEATMALAMSRKLHAGPNPADLKLLKVRLPKIGRRAGTHFPSLPYDKTPAFMRALAGQQGVAARCLEFAILCASRTGEAVGARWSEFDLDAALWTIPAERTKMNEEHIVTMSPAAVAIVRRMADVRENNYVFPSPINDGEPLCTGGLLPVLKRMNAAGGGWCDRDGRDAVPHGFRASFSSWAYAEAHYPAFVVEMAMGHAIDNDVVEAYQRSKLPEKRKALLAEWAAYVLPLSSVPMLDAA